MRQDGEASVEEILESIKKVIARDNRTSAETERKKRTTKGVESDEGQASTDDTADDVLDLGSAAFFEDDADSEEEDFSSPLIGDAVRASMQENLAALAMISEPSTPPQIVRSGETSLEGMVREMLRPMLAEWLDQNLPGMVESMVRNEINRIAGKRS